MGFNNENALHNTEERYFYKSSDKPNHELHGVNV